MDPTCVKESVFNSKGNRKLIKDFTQVGDSTGCAC